MSSSLVIEDITDDPQNEGEDTPHNEKGRGDTEKVMIKLCAVTAASRGVKFNIRPSYGD